jgi:fructokinase
MPDFIENFKFSTIVRCSSEDLEVLFPNENTTAIYQKYIAPYCKQFIVTQGEKEILLITETFEKNYPVEPFVPASTIGAGDNFNAGLIFGLIQEKTLLDDVKYLSEKQWDKLIESGKEFATAVCRSMENYVPRNWKFN